MTRQFMTPSGLSSTFMTLKRLYMESQMQSQSVRTERHAISSIERITLVSELSTSHYGKSDEIFAYIDKCTHIFRFILEKSNETLTPGLQIDIWVHESIFDAHHSCELFMWTRTMTRLIHRLLCVSKLQGFKMPPLRTQFVLVPVDQPREFPRSGQLIQPVHINGGFTYLHGNRVFVVRKEELPKVCLHEWLHHMQGDVPWEKEELSKIYKLMSIDTAGCTKNMLACMTDIRPNEAVVEAWACMLHAMFVSLDNKIDDLWERVLLQELSFARYQSHKLLKYQLKHYPRWIEGTHTFSYIILKCFILWDTLIQNHHGNTLITLLYEPPQLTSKFEQQWPLFLDYVQKKHKNNRDKLSPFPKQSLRMTVFGDF